MPRIDDKQPVTTGRAQATKPAAKGPEAAQGAAEAGKAVGIVRDALVKSSEGDKQAVKAAAAEASKGFWGRLKEGASGLWDKVKDGAGWVGDKVAKAGTWVAEGVMVGLMGAHSSKFETRDVYDDPSDVNHPTPKEVEAAKKAIAANGAKVEAALAKLSPEARKQYEKVAPLTVGRPTAELALQTMLLDGRLTEGKDLKGQGAALDHLATLAAQPLVKDVDRRTVVSEILGELENPVRINQHGVGTCGATTAQILLIRQNPAEYVRLMTGLASPAGKATMAGGDTITRVEDWNDDSDKNYGGTRTMASRLFQPAVMDYGEPLPGDRYDNSEDRAKWGPIPLFSGLMSLGAICDQLTGKDYGTVTLHRFNRDGAWGDLKTALKDGLGPVPVAVRWNTSGSAGGHFVQIGKVENGKVFITNPWGQRESFSEAEFKSHVTTLTMPKG